MSQPLERNTLHQQLLGALRRGIGEGRWRGELPSEAELCREFQVSRMTLRKAIAQLAAEGLIAPGGHGRRHRVGSRVGTRAAKPPATSGHIIRVLSPFGIGDLSTTNLAVLESLQKWVTKTGYVLELVQQRGLFGQFKPSKLKQLDAQPGTAAWLCCYGTEPIHRWLAESGRPTVVLGRVHGEIALSHVLPDSLAAARHAAGRLARCGHRELAYLIGSPTSLGDRLASEVFASEAERLGARARTYSHSSTAISVGRLVARLFSSRPRPTGLVVGAPEAAITVLCRLLAMGIRVPDQVAIVAMWDDTSLDFTFPTIARYRSDGHRMGRLIGKTIQELIRYGTGRVRSYPIMPDLVPGGTLGPVAR